MEITDSTCVTAIRAAQADINAGDIEAYLRRFEPACTRWVAGIGQSFTLAEVGESMRQLAAAFDPFRLDDEGVFGSDGVVCARWRLRGAHTGDYLGIPPSGREIDVPTCEIYRFDGDLVVATWTYGDPAELFRQIDDTGGPLR